METAASPMYDRTLRDFHRQDIDIEAIRSRPKWSIAAAAQRIKLERAGVITGDMLDARIRGALAAKSPQNATQLHKALQDEGFKVTRTRVSKHWAQVKHERTVQGG